MPIYQAGEVSTRVRQAEHVHVSLLQEVERAGTEVRDAVIATWSLLGSACAHVTLITLKSKRTSRRSAACAKKRRLVNALFWTCRTPSEQGYLNCQVQFVSNERNLVVAACALPSAAPKRKGCRSPIQEVYRKWRGISITHEYARRRLARARRSVAQGRKALQVSAARLFENASFIVVHAA
jgi:hypothetical protein